MNKWDIAHMRVAEVYASLSSAKRLKVGCVIVKENRIISIGYNGMPAGWDNECETRSYMDDSWDHPKEIRSKWPLKDEEGKRYKLITKPEVLHAEANAIGKLASSTESGDGSTLFTTTSPCIECAKLIYQTGVNKVYYKHKYKNDDGLVFLKKCGIVTEHYEESE